MGPAPPGRCPSPGSRFGLLALGRARFAPPFAERWVRWRWAMPARWAALVVTVAAVTLASQATTSAGSSPRFGVSHAPDRAVDLRAAALVFDKPEVVAHPRDRGSRPAVAISRERVVTAVWRQSYLGSDGTEKYAMRSARRGVDDHWSSPRTIACPRPGTCASRPPSGPLADPQIAVDKRGTVTVVWATATGVAAVRRGAGGPWGQPRQLASDPAQAPMLYLTLGVGSSGAVFVAWDSRSGVWLVRRPVGGPWSAPRRIDPHGFAPVVAVWPRGRAVLVYTQHPDNAPVVRAYTYVPRSGWSDPEDLGHGYSAEGALTVGPRHSALLVWNPDDQRVMARDMRHGEWRKRVFLGYSGEWAYGFAAAIDLTGAEIAGWVDYMEGDPNRGSVATRPEAGVWSRRMFGGASPGNVGVGPPIVVETNDANDAIAMFPRRTLFRPHGQAWTPPLKFGARAGVILPSGGALRLWWQDRTLLAQRVHLR